MYVYLIQRKDCPDSPIKIGYAANLQRRLRALQTGSPWKLEVKAAIKCESKDDAIKLEGCIHFVAGKRFKRLEGEWFFVIGSWKKLIEQAVKMSHLGGKKLTKKQMGELFT